MNCDILRKQLCKTDLSNERKQSWDLFNTELVINFDPGSKFITPSFSKKSESAVRNLDLNCKPGVAYHIVTKPYPTSANGCDDAGFNQANLKSWVLFLFFVVVHLFLQVLYSIF